MVVSMDVSLAAAPSFYTDISLDFREANGNISASRRILQLPLQVKKERELARAQYAQRPPRRAYTPFFVSDAILQLGKHDAQSQSSLLKLPAELLLLIVQKIQVPHYQVVFGLSCKTIASLLSENRESLAPWRGFRDKEGLYHLLARQLKPQARRCRASTSSSMETQVATATTENELPSYVPPALRLCRACFRHVPRDKIYWLNRMPSTEFDKPHVNWFDILNFFNESQRNCGQYRCPECCARNYTCFLSEREYDKALAEDYRDEEVYLIDLGDEGRRVCIELPRRLARP